MVCKVLTTAAFAHRFAVTTLRPRARDQLRRGPGPGKRAVKAGQHRLVHPAPHGQGSLRAWRCHHEGRLSKRGGGGGPGWNWNSAYQALTVLFQKHPKPYKYIGKYTGRDLEGSTAKANMATPKTVRKETFTICFLSSILFKLFSISLYSSYKVFQRISLHLFWRNKQVHQDGGNRRGN